MLFMFSRYHFKRSKLTLLFLEKKISNTHLTTKSTAITLAINSFIKMSFVIKILSHKMCTEGRRIDSKSVGLAEPKQNDPRKFT